MSEELLPPPRPVIPIDPGEILEPEPVHDDLEAIVLDDSPVMPISEPGVIAPAPFAQVYAPPASYDVEPSAPPALPVAQASYYPPAYPKSQEAAWPAPVAYRGSGADGYRRPTVISSLAVTAIIVACLSFLTSIFSGCTAVMITINARQLAAMATTPPVPAPSSSTSSSSASFNVSFSDGLGSEDRAVVIRSMRNRMSRSLSIRRQQQLDAFLTEHGGLIFDTSNGPLTSQNVSLQIAQVGQEFGTGGKPGPDYFTFRSKTLPGRLILKDDGAVYRPDDFTPAITSVANPDGSGAVSGGNIPAPTLATTGLSPQDAQAVLNRVTELSNDRLSSVQFAALDSILQSGSGLNYLTPSSTVPGLTAQVKSVAALSDGSIVITFKMRKLTLDRQGQVVGALPAPPPVAGAAPSVTPSRRVPPFVMGTFSVSRAACTMGIVDGVLSGFLAVYLLVIAILALRPSGASRLLFTLYAICKIVCGMIGIIGFAWMVNSLSTGSAPGFATSLVTGFKGMSSAALGLTCIGIAYPIAVLLVLTLSKTAREYYKAVE
jgi:hypothetical protein